MYTVDNYMAFWDHFNGSKLEPFYEDKIHGINNLLFKNLMENVTSLKDSFANKNEQAKFR